MLKYKHRIHVQQAWVRLLYNVQFISGYAIRQRLGHFILRDGMPCVAVRRPVTVGLHME